MYPLLFEIFGVKIHSYGVLVALAFLIGFALISRRAMDAGDNPDRYTEALLWFIISGIGGARAFYILWYPHLFLVDPIGVLTSQGGLVWYGGVVGALLASVIYTRLKKLNFLHFTDIVAPAAALGLAIGRIGCLLAGCCYGSPCSLGWAVHYPHTHETHGAAVHPTPLYETILMMMVMAILLKIDRRKPFEGFTTGWFLILASFIRFALEYLRGDRLLWLTDLNLSASQVVSLLGVLLGAGILLVQSSRKPAGKTASEIIAENNMGGIAG